MKTIAVVVGSLREGSFSLKAAKAVEGLSEGTFAFDYVDLSEIPMFNQDLEADLPPSVARAREQVQKAEGVLIVTPEYNRFFPPVLKNVIDWVSRPYGQSSWNGKPTAIFGVTPGGTNAVAAAMATNQLMTAVGGIVMGMPGVYLSLNDSHFDEAGLPKEESTQDFLKGWIAEFDAFVSKFAG